MLLLLNGLRRNQRNMYVTEGHKEKIVKGNVLMALE
jgi:hypothetical protein